MNKCVCLSVCLRDHIRSPHVQSTPFVHVTYNRARLDSPLAPLRYVMHFRFVDDLMFARNSHEYRRREKASTQTDPPEGSTGARAESDIYDCLVSSFDSERVCVS